MYYESEVQNALTIAAAASSMGVVKFVIGSINNAEVVQSKLASGLDLWLVFIGLCVGNYTEHKTQLAGYPHWLAT